LAERQYDSVLNIRTTGLREWADPNTLYNRYEATPYKALDKLYKNYKLKKGDRVVDFGSGRGRVSFYTHNKFHTHVIGIEAHDQTYDEAIENKQRYRTRAGHISAPIYFEYGLAESYEIDPEDNIFYFFNPFSIKIFRQVINNILKSFKENKRTIDIIIYYTIPEYRRYMDNKTPFQLLNRIKLPGMNDPLEEFLIYRIDIE